MILERYYLIFNFSVPCKSVLQKYNIRTNVLVKWTHESSNLKKWTQRHKKWQNYLVNANASAALWQWTRTWTRKNRDSLIHWHSSFFRKLQKWATLNAPEKAQIDTCTNSIPGVSWKLGHSLISLFLNFYSSQRNELGLKRNIKPLPLNHV